MAENSSGECRIARLAPSLVNRIAAGEVIHRPANAVKEMLENSIDAGSQNINLLLKDGGLKLLQISDDGCGIGLADLPLLCERFATSKLKAFDDLQSMETFGFRGEALASISHVAHLSVVTRTSSQQCAYKALYGDGILKRRPTPTAGVRGTTICVEDLFYNVTTRRKALRSSSEEYNLVLQIVLKYALQYPSIAFSCKKTTSGTADIQTQGRSSIADNLRILFGNDVSKNAMKVEAVPEPGTSLHDVNFKATGYCTGPNYHKRKGTYIFFINKRLIESTVLKKGIEAVYHNYLPRHTHPFVYISIEMSLQHVDVNVHPTKKEVRFLHEAAVIEILQRVIDEMLIGPSTARTFKTQGTLTGISAISGRKDDVPHTEAPEYQYHKIRTDYRSRKIDSFLSTSTSIEDQSRKRKREEDSCELHSAKKVLVDLEPKPMLTSVEGLLDEIRVRSYGDLVHLFQHHTFVGVVDLEYGLVQYSTKLYLVNLEMLTSQLVYQEVLSKFGRMSAYRFDTPIDLDAILALGDFHETERQEKSRTIISCLEEKAPILREYFAMHIEDGQLHSLPIIFPHYFPSIDYLPNFLSLLANNVDWSAEETCFGGVARAFSGLYALRQTHPPDDSLSGTEDVTAARPLQWQIEHSIFPAARKFLPSTDFAHGGLIEIARLEDLYKVFERC